MATSWLLLLNPRKIILQIVLLCPLTFALQIPNSVDLGHTCGNLNEAVFNSTRVAPWTALIELHASKNAQASVSKTTLRLSGVIIGPTKVVTLWGSRFSEMAFGNERRLPDPQLIYGISGLSSPDPIDVYDIGQRMVQFFEVKHIVPFNNGEINISEAEFYPIVLHLSKPLVFDTDFVQPICLPSKNPTTEDFLEYSANAKISAFHYHSSRGIPPVLLIKPSLMAPVDSGFCRWLGHLQSNTGGPICSFQPKFSKDGNNFCGAHLGVISLNLNQRHFFAGFTANQRSDSKILTEQICVDANPPLHTYAINLTDHGMFDWIVQNRDCGENTFSCPTGKCISLDKVCDLENDCPLLSESSTSELAYDEDEHLCSFASNCKEPRKFPCGYQHGCIREDELCNGKSNCQNGFDEFPNVCLNAIKRALFKAKAGAPSNYVSSTSTTKSPIKIQTPLPTRIVTNSVSLASTTKSPPETQTPPPTPTCGNIQLTEGVSQNCSFNGSPTSCNSAGPGAKMFLSCLPEYTSKIKFKSLSVTCRQNGYWNPNPIFACEAPCGRLDGGSGHGVRPFISNGDAANKRKRFPWYAAIFIENPKTRTYRVECGATLIGPTVLITAAHCVTAQNGSPIDTKSLRVVFSPESSNFEMNIGNSGSSIREVSVIRIAPTYDKTTYYSDLSIVIVSKRVDYSEWIQPVCYTLDEGVAKPKHGTIGLVAGFGENPNENVQETENLKFGSFVTLSDETCSKTSLGFNAFCAGSSNDTNARICQKDEGGGIFFKGNPNQKSRYFIKGIVSKMSSTPSDNCEGPYKFTLLDNYIEWIFVTLDALGLLNN